MIVYDPSEIFSTLWWMEGSVIPGILFLAAISGMNGIVAVYFKENYNYYITSTTHSLMASTLGFFLILKNCLAFFHFHSAKRTVHDLLDAMRTLAIHVQAYGVARSEDEARDIVNTYTNLSKHLVVMFYSLTLHLRKQNVLPPKSRLPLYLYPWELSKWNEATVRPLACLVMINNDISKLRNKGIYSDQVACMMSKEVKRMTQIFGEMEKLKDSPTIPFAYYQFCNWTTLAYSLTVPAAIGTYDTYYTATSLLSFFVAALFIGLNFIGNLLQNPFGLGPNDIPLEQWGQSLENELYQHFPIFKFRFGAFPLFVEDFTAYPPEDRRALYKDDSSITMFHKPSAWIVTRNKIRAAMRLGNRKLKKFREAKPTREAIVAEIMRDRRKQAFDDMSLLVQQFGAAPKDREGSNKNATQKYSKVAAEESASHPAETSEMDNKEERESETMQDKADEILNTQLRSRGRRSRAPAELTPKPAIVKQASLLIKRFPESEEMQQMYQQIINPNIPDVDKTAMLALMNAEANALSDEIDLDLH